MRFSRLVSGLLLSMVLSTLLAAVLPAQRVDAAVSVSATFVNRYAITLNNLAVTDNERTNGELNDDLNGLSIQEINQYIAGQLNGKQLVDDNMTDSTEQYVYSNNNCNSAIKFQDGRWELIQFSIIVQGQGCKEVMPGEGSTDIPLAGRNQSGALDVTKSNVWFTWQTENSMKRVDGRDGEFVLSSVQANKYFRVDEAGEDHQDYIDLNPLTTNNELEGAQYFIQYDNKNPDIIAVLIDGKANKQNPPSTANPPAGSGGQVDGSCESSSGPLGWIMCPIAGLLDGVTGWLDDQIQDLLIIKEESFFKGEGGEGLKKAWMRVRDIAYVLLIPTALIMVIGTALGFEVFSAYTVKKALPRMVLAVIFITFSWYICVFTIELFNVIGTGAKGIVTFPFRDELRSGLKGALDAAGVTRSGDQGVVSAIGEGVGALGLAAAGFTLFAGGYISVTIIMSLLFSTAVILGIAFIVLVARQMFIIALIFLGPLAILAWIFPGNDKPWRLWWLTFSRLLLMFPLIMVIIGVGEVFAYVAGHAGSGGNMLFTAIIVVAAVIVPYLFIPFTFKFAGGIFANLAGMVNDRNKGLLDRSKKHRAEERAKMREQASGNNRWAGNNKWSRFGNKVGGWASSPLANTAYYGRVIPGLRAKGEAIKSSIEGAASEQTGKLTEELNEKYKFNDKAYRSLSGSFNGFKASTRAALVNNGLAQWMVDRDGNIMLDKKGDRMVTGGKAPTTIQDFHKMADILGSSDDATEQVASNVLRSAAGRLATLHNDPEKGKASLQAAGITGLAAHGFANGDDLAYVGNDMMKKGFSSEMVQTFINGAQVAGQRQRPDIKAGYGTVFLPADPSTGKEARFVNGMTEGGRDEKLVLTLNSADLASAKSGALEDLTPTITRMLSNTADVEGERTAQAVKDQLFNWAGPYSQASVAVKKQALSIIETQSGPKGNYTRTVPMRDPSSGQVRQVQEQYYGYAPGTIGEEFERRTRAETDPTTRGEIPGREEE